jgi:hypothetical protein
MKLSIKALPVAIYSVIDYIISSDKAKRPKTNSIYRQWRVTDYALRKMESHDET